MDESALEQLVIENPDFAHLNAAMNVFCPFDAVGMTDREVKHGRFLQYILDPARPHGFGDACLRAFMRTVTTTLSGADLGFAPLDVHLMELDGAVVHRERDSIDLLIEVPTASLVIAIELKINASEHSGQLGRYRRIVERDWPRHKHLLLFLTKRGDQPSADGAGWHALSLSPVANALHAVAKRQTGASDAQMMLAAYVAMLRREHLTDERLEHIAQSLWREHREALEFLMERRPDNRYAQLATLLTNAEKVAARISSLTTLKVEADHSTKSIVRFAVADWDVMPGFLTALNWTKSKRAILLEVKERGSGVRVEFQLGPTPRRREIFEALIAAGADIGSAGGMGEKWRQLANTTFVVDPDAPQEQQIEYFAKVLSDFLTKREPLYREALSKVLSS